MICLLSAVDLLLSSSAAHYCSHKAARSGERQGGGEGGGYRGFTHDTLTLVNLGVCSLKIAAAAAFIGERRFIFFPPASPRRVATDEEPDGDPESSLRKEGTFRIFPSAFEIPQSVLEFSAAEAFFFFFLTIQKSSEPAR